MRTGLRRKSNDAAPQMMEARTPGASRVEILGEMLRTADGRRELADELEPVLLRNGLDAHWPATRDAEHGGFLTGLDRRWRPVGEQTKSLEFIARQTWAFARAAQAYPGRGYDEAARHGFVFLTERMWDAEHGGFFTLVDRAGKPLENGRKHPHGHTYAVEVFVNIAPVVGEDIARTWALRTFGWLETVAWDAEHGGYWGYFERDNTRIRRDEDRRGYDWLATPLGLKDLNVIVDALTTLTSLAARNWDDRAAVRLQWHVAHFLDDLIPRFETLPYLYTPDWQTAPDIPRAGQPLQLVTALLKATRQTGRLPEALAACRKIKGACNRYFASPAGGFGFANSLYGWAIEGVDLTVPVRSWWIQNEAVRGSLLLAVLEPEDAGLRQSFARQWTFIEEHLIDHRFGGFFESAEQGASARRWHADNSAKPHKCHIWKDVSHEAHLLVDGVGWLRKGHGLS